MATEFTVVVRKKESLMILWKQRSSAPHPPHYSPKKTTSRRMCTGYRSYRAPVPLYDCVGSSVTGVWGRLTEKNNHDIKITDNLNLLHCEHRFMGGVGRSQISCFNYHSNSVSLPSLPLPRGRFAREALRWMIFLASFTVSLRILRIAGR